MLDDATRLIDQVTGWFFEPRRLTLILDGRGTSSIEPSVPPIQLERLLVRGAALSLDELIVVGAPIRPGFSVPRISLRWGRFPRGRGAVEASGLWGYTELNGTARGRTPRAIRRACLLLAMRSLPKLSEEASFDARSRWRIIEERTRDQSYRLDPLKVSGQSLTGDPEIDQLLLPFVRPRPLIGAA